MADGFRFLSRSRVPIAVTIACFRVAFRILRLTLDEVAGVFILDRTSVDDDVAHLQNREVIRSLVVDDFRLGAFLPFHHRARRDLERTRADGDRRIVAAVVKGPRSVGLNILPVTHLGRGGALELNVEGHAVSENDLAVVHETCGAADRDRMIIHHRGRSLAVSVLADGDGRTARVGERAARNVQVGADEIEIRSVREFPGRDVDRGDALIELNGARGVGDAERAARNLDRLRIGFIRTGLDVDVVAVFPSHGPGLFVGSPFPREVPRNGDGAFRNFRLELAFAGADRQFVRVLRRVFAILGPSRLHAQAERSADRENQRRLLRENVVRHHLVSLGF